MAQRGPIELGAPRTRRQWIADRLREREHGFEELRILLQLSVRELADDLRHVARSTRHGEGRFQVVPSSCLACGFVFRDRERRRLDPPGRCPRCRSERIEDPRFRIAATEERGRRR